MTDDLYSTASGSAPASGNVCQPIISSWGPEYLFLCSQVHSLGQHPQSDLSLTEFLILHHIVTCCFLGPKLKVIIRYYLFYKNVFMFVCFFVFCFACLLLLYSLNSVIWPKWSLQKAVKTHYLFISSVFTDQCLVSTNGKIFPKDCLTGELFREVRGLFITSNLCFYNQSRWKF